MILEADGVCAFAVLLVTMGVVAMRNGADARSVTVHEAVAY
jgi:hypothetical protein